MDLEDQNETLQQDRDQGGNVLRGIEDGQEAVRETPVVVNKKKGKRGPRVKVVVEAIPTDRVTRNTARVSI